MLGRAGAAYGWVARRERTRGMFMADGPKRSVAAVVMGVATLAVAAPGGGFALLAAALGDTGTAVVFASGAGVVSVGGLWCAWRVGTGHWGLRRGSTPTAPFRFFASRSDVVLAPGTRNPVGNLVKDGEYTAVEVCEGEVLVEDALGRRGWVPDSVVPARVRRSQRGAGVTAARDGGRGAMMAGGRRRHPMVEAVLMGLVTVAGVFVGSVLWSFAIGITEGDSGRSMPGGEKAVGWVILAAVLVGGLWCAWLVGSGRVRPRHRVWGPTHQVPAGGMKAWGRQDTSGESIDLPEHLPLHLDKVKGSWARVTGSNGATGWVQAGLLVPLSTPPAQAEPPAPEAEGQEGGP
jgi:hypothetical protein